MASYKIIGRYKREEDQKPWCKGKVGNQAKKRVYSRECDYFRYGPELVKRWNKMFDLECFKLVEDDWVKIELLDNAK